MIKYKDLTVKRKLLAFVIPTIFILTSFITIISTTISRIALKESIINSFSNFADLKVSRIEDFYHKTQSSVTSLQYNGTIHKYLTSDSIDISEIDNSNLKTELSTLLPIHNFKSISLWRSNNTLIYCSENNMEMSDKLKLIGSSDNSKIQFSSIRKDSDDFIVYITAPIINNGKVVGKLLIKQSMKPIYALIQDTRGFGETGETLIGKKTEEGAIFLNPLRHDLNAALNRKAKNGSEAAKPILEAVNGRSDYGIQLDYRAKEVIAIWKYIPSFDWGFVAKIDVSEAYEPIYNLIYKIIFATLITIIITVLLTINVSNKIVKPVINLKESITVIGRGNILKEKIKKDGNDEIGQMVDQANNLTWFLSNIITFAKEIGKGNFEYKTELDMNQGELGKSLIHMSENLRKVAYSERKRTWSTEGLAKFANILRMNNDDLDILSENIIINIVKYLNANQGGIYIINDDLKSPKMELKSAYAYERKKFLENKFELGEGLVGQCWQEKEKIFLTEVPQNYINITSGLGTANPSCILLVPLIVSDEIYGIIELASFQVFDEHEIDFIEKLSSSIASTLNSVKVNIRTSTLLEETQQMSEELQSQEEELRQNAEEMQATQEEMERAQKELIRKENSLRSIIDNSADTIFAINTNYEIMVVNSTLRKKYKALGINLNDEKNILNLIPQDKIAFWKERYDRVFNGETFQTEDEVAPGVMATVYHYPTYDENKKITGAAIVSRQDIN